MPESYLDNYRQVIEEALRRFFPLPDAKAQIVNEAMAYSLFSGGKRLRPILTLLSTEAVGGDSQKVLPTACAIEFIHTYSLIHDDLPAMDNDTLRRGQPTCHLMYGEDIAILAGDGLLTEAFALIARRQTGKTDNIVRAISELAAAVGIQGMIGGQAIDIKQDKDKMDVEAVKYIHSLKTGKLITASARCGVILAGASAAALASISDYAVNLGLAFQITDDILDVVGTTAVLGKNTGSDVRLSKPTFPSILGLKKSKEQAHRAIDAAKRALNGGVLVEKDALLWLADFVLERQS